MKNRLNALQVDRYPLSIRTTRVKRSAFYCEEEGVLRETKTQIKLSNILQPPESKGHKEGENIKVEALWIKIVTF